LVQILFLSAPPHAVNLSIILHRTSTRSVAEFHDIVMRFNELMELR